MKCEEKKKFDSRAAVVTFLKRVIRKKRKEPNQYPYLCPECHYWHITTQYD
jgi:hypothetical protein